MSKTRNHTRESRKDPICSNRWLQAHLQREEDRLDNEDINFHVQKNVKTFKFTDENDD
jgi:hypothetical protein